MSVETKNIPKELHELLDRAHARIVQAQAKTQEQQERANELITGVGISLGADGTWKYHHETKTFVKNEKDDGPN